MLEFEPRLLSLGLSLVKYPHMKNSMLKLTLVFVLFILSLTSRVSANEGVIQMESLDQSGAKCFVVSTLLADFQYKMLINCRGLKYPISQNLFQYVMWADHGEGNPTRLGTLGVGKREFSSPKAFNRLFVTKESGSEPRDPSEFLYMSGGVAGIAFLDGAGPEVAQATPEPTSTPVIAPIVDTTTQPNIGVGSVIRVLGIAVLVIVVLVIVIAFVSASRRRPIDI